MTARALAAAALLLFAAPALAQDVACVRLNVTPAGIVLGSTGATQIHVAQDTPGVVVGGLNFAYRVIWESGFRRDGTRVSPVEDARRPYQHVKFSDRCPVFDE